MKHLKLTLVKSLNGRIKNHQANARGLGLSKRMHRSVIVADTPCNRGMINKIAYLLKIEEV